jgi:hypothetical protein
MSVKKDRLGKRRWRNARGLRGSWWHVPRAFKYGDKFVGRRYTRARIRQLMREGEFDALPRYRRDAGYSYW